MAKYADAVLAHHAGHFGGGHPIADFAPCFLVLQMAGNEMVGDAGAVEDAGDFRS